MLKTLYAKLAVVLLALFCVIGGIYVALTMLTTRLYLEEVNQKLNRTLAANGSSPAARNNSGAKCGPERDVTITWTLPQRSTADRPMSIARFFAR